MIGRIIYMRWQSESSWHMCWLLLLLDEDPRAVSNGMDDSGLE